MSNKKLTCPRCGNSGLDYDKDELQIKGSKIILPVWCPTCSEDFGDPWKANLLLFKRSGEVFLEWSYGDFGK
jgi:hypothetical protein